MGKDRSHFDFRGITDVVTSPDRVVMRRAGDGTPDAACAPAKRRIVCRVEGNRIEDYDLDAVVRRFQAAVARALAEGRNEDASDFLIAEQIVCVIRGDYLPDAEAP